VIPCAAPEAMTAQTVPGRGSRSVRLVGGAASGILVAGLLQGLLLGTIFGLRDPWTRDVFLGGFLLAAVFVVPIVVTLVGLVDRAVRAKRRAAALGCFVVAGAGFGGLALALVSCPFTGPVVAPLWGVIGVGFGAVTSGVSFGVVELIGPRRAVAYGLGAAVTALLAVAAAVIFVLD